MLWGLRSKKETLERYKSTRLSENTPFNVVEAYKMLRTNLIFTLNKVGCKKIIVTSGLAREGKSTTSANLAIVLAQMNSRVLLVDCDLRKASVHKIFKINCVPGISDLLAGLCQPIEALHDTDQPNLKVICAGTMPPNPGELLGSDDMEAFILQMEENFDYIIIDTPPVNMVSDALTLSKFCDGVIVVARQNQTIHSELSKTLSRLAFVEAKVLGLILNDAEMKKGYYHYKYGKHGRYGKKYQEYEYSEST